MCLPWGLRLAAALALAIPTLALGGKPSSRVIIARDLAYLPDGDPAHTYDLYCPQAVTTAPLVVIAHAGGGITGDKREPWARRLAWRLARDGFVAATVNYRLAPRHPWPAAAKDIRAAVTHLQHRAERLGAGPQPPFLVGFSAGGLLARMALVGGMPASGVVGICAPATPANLRGPDWVGRLLHGAQARTASPLHHLEGNLPPVLLIHGQADTIVPLPHALALRQQLRDRQCPVRLVVLPGVGHLMTARRATEECYPQVARWLRQHTALQRRPPAPW